MDIRHIMSLSPVIPVLTVSRLEHAVPLAQALSKGGLSVLEITLRTPIALEAIRAIRNALPKIIVGAGTLLCADDFTAANSAGAQFGVSPGFNRDVLEAARSVSFPLLPGVMTPSEVMTARLAGYSALKLFPAQQAGGIGMLRAMFGPFSDVVFCPTGGITRESAPEYLALPNVRCVGGSWFAPQQLMENGDWLSIEKIAKEAAALGSSQPATGH